MQGLVDPDTQRGSQPGAWLLRPFHESLLWYDARKPSPNSPQYTVCKVYMRGSGITLARMLADPADASAAALGRSAVAAIRSALTAASPNNVQTHCKLCPVQQLAARVGLKRFPLTPMARRT